MAQSNDKVKVTEDFCYEEFDSLADGLDWIRGKGVEVTVVKAEGSGGGWPEIELSGDREAVTRLLKDSWSATDAELEGRLTPA